MMRGPFWGRPCFEVESIIRHVFVGRRGDIGHPMNGIVTCQGLKAGRAAPGENMCPLALMDFTYAKGEAPGYRAAVLDNQRLMLGVWRLGVRVAELSIEVKETNLQDEEEGNRVEAVEPCTT